MCFPQNEETFKRRLTLGSVLFQQTRQQQGLGHFRLPLLALGHPQDDSHLRGEQATLPTSQQDPPQLPR